MFVVSIANDSLLVASLGTPRFSGSGTTWRAFIKASRIKMDTEEEPPGCSPVAAIKLKAPTLPKFSDNQEGQGKLNLRSEDNGLAKLVVSFRCLTSRWFKG